jgi:TonB family protein
MNANLLLNDVAVYSLQIGLLVGLAGFVPAALRLRAPGVKLAYWHFLLAACLLLPVARPWKQGVVDISAGAALPAVAMTTAPAAPTPAPARFSQAEMLLALLAAGAVVRLGWLGVGLWRLRRYRLHSAPAGAGGADERVWASVAERIGIPDLRLSEDVASPVTFGFLNPVILLPTAFPGLNPRTQEAILAHEFLHVRRRNWLFTLIEEVVRAAFWFHPAIWWLLGETQLAREQVVDRASVEMTRSREEYVDALLAIAGVRPRLDLAPAPLFLRKRHLKHRVVSLLKEVRMSKKHSIAALAAGLSILAAACWMVTATFPLAAAPQLVADGPGVSVDIGGAALMHRLPVVYPEAAITAWIEGTVVVQATVDSAGNVTDASVLSGPEELRKTAIQSVLQWHFVRGGSSTKQVSIAFRLPPENSQPAAAPGAIEQRRPTGQSTGALVFSGQTAQAPPAPPPAASAPFNAIMAEMQALRAQVRDANTLPDQQTMTDIMNKVRDLNDRRLALEKIRAITTPGLSDQIRAELLASLPIHVGDAPTTENMAQLRDAVKQFDEHLSVSTLPGGSPEEVDVRIAASGSLTQFVTTGNPTSGTRVIVGAKVQEASVIHRVMPAYPSLAKATGIQGHVVLAVVIGTNGSVQEVQAVSGHPLLIPAAMDAVKQWTYKPLLLNGQPVEVSTQVDVNFTLM